MNLTAMKNFLLTLFVFGTICCFGQNLNQNLNNANQAQIPCPSCLHGAPNPNYTGPPVKHYGNGNSTLGLSYVVQNLCGLNYVQATVLGETRTKPLGFNTNGTGYPTTVAIAGLPAGFVLQKAYVYYGGSYTEPTPPATSVSITNPALVNSVIASTMIGDGGDVCWGTTGTCGYRCDVTAAISGNGNYGINLIGFANASYEMDGVTLIIMYTDPAATYSGNIALWDGNMWNSTGAPLTYTGTGFTSCAPSSSANTFGLFGDMQSNTCGGTNTEDFNGSTATFNNDFWQFNDISTSVTACQSSCVFNGYTNNSGCDCWLWNLAGLYWQYTTCASCNAMTVSSVNVNPSCGVNNGSITVNVVGGAGPYTYTWTPAVSTSAIATSLSAGTYQITVHDAGCNVQTLSVTLTMVSLNVAATVTNILCAGQNNGSASFVVGGGVAPYTYTWAPIVNSTSSASGLSAGTYTVKIEDNTGCLNTQTFTISQPPVLTANVTPTGALCNGKADGSITSLVAGGTGAYTYAWAPGGANTANASGLSAGCYTLTTTDNSGCTVTATACVTQPTALTVNVTGPSMICIGATGTLTANVAGGTGAYTYAWSPGIASTTSTATITPVIPQTYTATITDANGCTASTDITVTLGTPLSLSIPQASSICSGMSTNICVTVNGGTGSETYSWQPGNLATPCVTVSPASTTTYTVSVVDQCGTTSTISTTVRVNPLPIIGFNANLYQGCTPLCMQFYNTTTLSQGSVASYVWAFGDGDTLQSKSPAYCYRTGGKFDVSLTVTSDSGCSSTLKKSNLITAYAHPSAAFTVSPQPATIIAPTIQFADKSSGTYNILSWSWGFGDGSDSTSTLQNPSHTYQDTGRYCANLVILDEHGCTDTATNCLVIDPAFNLYIPSAFTPNGDGKNEIFEPKGQYVKSFEMYIFDRWGMQLYHTTDITKGWNGTVGGGQIAQEDTYVYKIFVTDSQNKQHTYVGNVNLIK